MRYYLFILANFLAAFGGGLILRNGIKVLDGTDYFKEGSPLAFLIGAASGIILLQILPDNWKRFVALCFSISGGCTSVVLLVIFSQYSDSKDKINGNAAWFFFFFLCVRFSFWFYSRVLRVQYASAKKSGISLVEFGYHLGMALGIIFWTLTGIEITLKIALVVDAVLQIVAGIIDIIGNLGRKDLENESTVSGESTHQSSSLTENAPAPAEKISFDYPLYWRITVAVVLLTVGFQVITFSIVRWGKLNSGSFILASFYIGVTLATLAYSILQIKLDWKTTVRNKIDSAIIVFKDSKISFNLLTIIGWGFLFFFIAGISLKIAEINSGYNFDINIFRFWDLILLISITVAAFTCEIIVLALIYQVSENEKAANLNGRVLKSYGFLAIGAALGLIFLGRGSNFKLNWLIVAGLCLIGTNLLIWKRAKPSHK